MSSAVPPKNNNLIKNIRNYLENSYHYGYKLDTFFTEDDQITMFKQLLSCDEIFKQKWKNGVYSTPKDPKQTMFLSEYTEKQSDIKKNYRNAIGYNSNNKLTEGAKNLLEAYMREYVQDRENAEDKPNYVNNVLDKIFCGTIKQAREKREDVINQALDRLPVDPANIVKGYLRGGTKKRLAKKKKKRHTTLKTCRK